MNLEFPPEVPKIAAAHSRTCMVRTGVTTQKPEDGSAADSLAGRSWINPSPGPASGSTGSPGPERWEADRSCCLREFNFLGLVVLITAVETVDNLVLPRDPAVKPCSWTVGWAGFKQGVDGDNIFRDFRDPQTP